MARRHMRVSGTPIMCQSVETTMAAERQLLLRDRLQRIADALGTTAEALIEGAKDQTYGDDTAELVRLWFKITDPNDRRYLLDQVRKAAELS